MNKKVFRIFIAICLLVSSFASAQENKNILTGNEDPLIPQAFAVDYQTQTIAVIDTPENTIAILSRNASGFDVVKEVLVDVTKKRHDVQFIYNPKSVAIYDHNVIFLASNRDSCYFRVMDLKGNDIYLSPKFSGNASAFSYDKATKRLYIAGNNARGYNIFDIDVSNGFSNIVIDTISTDKAAFKNYTIPKKADEIKKHDKYGLGLTVIAMSTVFSALIIISIVLMGFAKILRNARKTRAKKIFPTPNMGIELCESSNQEEIFLANHLLQYLPLYICTRMNCMMKKILFLP